MDKLTKGMRMCLAMGLHCDRTFICRLATQAWRMGLRLEYTKEDIDGCPAFAQMIHEGSL